MCASPRSGEGKWSPCAPPRGAGRGVDRRVLFQPLGDRGVELVQALVDLDHLVAAHRLGGVDVSLVLGPFRAALTAVEDIPIRSRAGGENGRVFRTPSAGHLA